jgi:hypothetical protein
MDKLQQQFERGLAGRPGSLGDARQLAKALLVVHLLFTLAFGMAWRATTRQTGGGHP